LASGLVWVVVGRDAQAGITAGGRISVTSGRAVTYTPGACTPTYEALRVRRRLLSRRRHQSRRCCSSAQQGRVRRRVQVS
jgi:hypothetical protein